MWILLSAGFLIYVIILIISALSVPGKGKKMADSGQAVSNAPKMGVSRDDSQRVASNIQARIQSWKQVPDVLLEGQMMIDRGQIAEAESRLRSALESNPRVARLQIKLADVFAKQKKYIQARDLLMEVLETDPDNYNARLLLGSIFDSQTNYTASLAMANWILEKDPQAVEAHQMAANAYMNTDRSSLAVRHLQKIVLIERDNAVAENKLAEAYMKMGQYNKAIQILNEILDKNTTEAMTFYNLSICYAKQSMAQLSVETLARAAAIFGNDFVGTWVGAKSREFDSIRTDPAFVAFMRPREKEIKEAAASNSGSPSEMAGTNTPPAAASSSH